MLVVEVEKFSFRVRTRVVKYQFLDRYLVCFLFIVEMLTLKIWFGSSRGNFRFQLEVIGNFLKFIIFCGFEMKNYFISFRFFFSK